MDPSQDVPGHPFFWLPAGEGTASELDQWAVETLFIGLSGQGSDWGTVGART